MTYTAVTGLVVQHAQASASCILCSYLTKEGDGAASRLKLQYTKFQLMRLTESDIYAGVALRGCMHYCYDKRVFSPEIL